MIATAELVSDPGTWQRRCAAARDSGRRIALVPTMGCLHEGHVSLLREARRRADAGPRPGLALASIFVNPTQFGRGEDLARYPRDLGGDLEKCAAAGIDAVFAPEDAARVYAREHESWVDVERLSQGLCGAKRPGHFRGVATVVAKLLNLSRPHVAVFGEKDFQQLCVVRAMVRDLDFGVEIVGMPTVRDADGLALSSRNAHLSAGERQQALSLSRALFDAQARVARGERDATVLAAAAREILEASQARIDYVEIVDPLSLAPVPRAESGSRMLVAAYIGATRLIDNIMLP